MPVHDWSDVDANVFHHFHQAWALHISMALNGLLPEGYSALVEQHSPKLVPDVLAVERRVRPRNKHPPEGGWHGYPPQAQCPFHGRNSRAADRRPRPTRSKRSSSRSPSGPSSRTCPPTSNRISTSACRWRKLIRRLGTPARRICVTSSNTGRCRTSDTLWPSGVDRHAIAREILRVVRGLPPV